MAVCECKEILHLSPTTEMVVISYQRRGADVDIIGRFQGPVCVATCGARMTRGIVAWAKSCAAESSNSDALYEGSLLHRCLHLS